MKTKKILISVLVLVSFEGCNIQKEPNKSFETTVACENIVNSDDSDFNDIVEKYDMIKLETNKECLIGNIQKLCIQEKRIYILSGNIYCFNMKGEFIYSISKKGKGPGEFLKLQDFSIDDTLLYVYDNFGRKINVHNAIDGRFILNISTLHSSHEMEVEGGFSHFNRLSISNKFIKGSEMLISHQLNSPEDITTNFPLELYIGKINNQLIKTNSSCMWLDPVGCNVYKIKGNIISNYLDLDFGKSNVSPEEISTSIYSTNSDLRNAGKVHGLEEYYETSKLITAKLFLGNNMGYLIIDKANKNSVVFKGFFRNLEPYQFFETVISSDSTNFYSIVTSPIIHKQAEKMNESQLNTLDENMKNIFKSTKISDNPIILVYKYKNSTESSIY